MYLRGTLLERCVPFRQALSAWATRKRASAHLRLRSCRNISILSCARSPKRLRIAEKESQTSHLRFAKGFPPEKSFGTLLVGNFGAIKKPKQFKLLRLREYLKEM